MTGILAEQLQAYLASRYPDAVLSNFDFLVSGFESEIYTFVVQRSPSPQRNYDLRLFNGEGATEKLIREARGLSLLQKADYPVPGLLLQEPDPGILGRPFEIIDRLEGQALWPVLASTESHQMSQLVSRFGLLLARLHKLDWRSFVANPAPVENNPILLVEEILSSYRSLYKKYDLKGFLRILDWLDAHKHEISVRPSIVHQDFHANNVFLCSNDQLVVLDWTQFAVADFRIDLCWTLLIMGDMGSAGWGKVILDTYTAEFNDPIEHTDYFNIIAYMKLLASTVIAFNYGPQEVGLRPNAIQLTREQLSAYKQFSRRLQNNVGIQVHELANVLDRIQESARTA